MPEMDPSALALEYQGVYGAARGNPHVTNLVNNPVASGKSRIFGFCLTEEIGDRVLFNSGPLFNDGADPLLVCKDGI